MTWHLDASTLDRYVRGDIGEASAFSVEAHLLACHMCREAMAAQIEPARLDRIWADVRDEVEVPGPRWVERLLLRCGVRPNTARLVATTESVSLSWMLAVAVSIGFAVLAATWFGGSNVPFLTMAPIVPVAGIAVSFGRSVDPTWEIGQATPTGGFYLTLIRAATVLTVSLMSAGVGSLALPHAGWIAAAWLMPALGLTLLTLALSTSPASTGTVAAIVSASWVAAVTIASRLAADPVAAFKVGGQVTLSAIAVLSAIVLFARQDAFEQRPTTPGGWR